jgi:hypothetical protein
MNRFTSIITFISLLIAGILLNPVQTAYAQQVEVRENAEGWTLLVDDKPFMVNGMNWDYYPVGKTYNYSLWMQSPEFIKQALEDEMSLLQNMGVNAIRVYTGIPREWVEYIYDEYGIFTVLNHSFGRYGLTIDGAWMPNTEYSMNSKEHGVC